jgi:hypothetical protein
MTLIRAVNELSRGQHKFFGSESPVPIKQCTLTVFFTGLIVEFASPVDTSLVVEFGSDLGVFFDDCCPLAMVMR